jgi:hypothetical protein
MSLEFGMDLFDLMQIIHKKFEGKLCKNGAICNGWELG